MSNAKWNSAMSRAAKFQHYRSPEEITAEGRGKTKKIVETAYWKAEKEQWHTKDERQKGRTQWAGGKVQGGTMEDREGKMKSVRWSEYRKPRRVPGTTDGPFKKEPIIPTCPPHPVGEPAAKTSRGGRKGDKWGQVIQQWVAEVRKEDEKRKKSDRKRQMN